MISPAPVKPRFLLAERLQNPGPTGLGMLCTDSCCYLSCGVAVGSRAFPSTKTRLDSEQRDEVKQVSGGIIRLP